MGMDKINTLVADALSVAKMTISVELGTTLKTVKEVFVMGEGTVVELDKFAGEPVDVKANGVLIALGEVMVIDEKFGVRITEITDTHGASEQSEHSEQQQPAQEPPESSSSDIDGLSEDISKEEKEEST
jgi:flagellar motor switch protein FliN